MTIGVMAEFDGLGSDPAQTNLMGNSIILFVPTIIVLIFIHICNVELTQLVACLMEWLGLP